MAMKSCPCCGAGILPDSILPTRQQRIYDYVRRYPGANIDAIMDYVYADDVHGGPDSRNIIYVLVCKANKILRAQGLKIKSVPGINRGYRVVTIGST